MSNDLWWQYPLRTIQYNLQIQDTAGMDPKKMAAETKELGANAVVLNAGGIYAWYPSKVKYHHINEYLPIGRDLWRELLDAFHQEGIRVIARFDFSKTDDTVYLQHPEWFVKDNEGQPLIYGGRRMGNWSLLLSTCVNGGFRRDSVAAKVLTEVLETYPIDGIFYNAPQMEACWCENCRRKYRKLYGNPLPENAALWEKDWQQTCLKENMKLLYDTIKESKPELPVILYYGTYRSNGSGGAENLEDRYATADMICTEAQDILSAGRRQLPQRFKPAMIAKLGDAEGNRPKPFGIIHSAPGMEWRHTGLPAAEYSFWMSQVTAAGGMIWHSLTGYCDTIRDKRILDMVKQINKKAAYVQSRSADIRSAADTLLLWNAGRSELGFAEGMMECSIPFEVMNIWNLDAERMATYPVVILPDRFPLDAGIAGMLTDYVLRGGSLLAEKTTADGLEFLAQILGVEEEASGGAQTAAYGYIENGWLKDGFMNTCYIPIRGDLLYVKALEGVQSPLTLVPSFAPLDGVGAPPERASMPVSRTDIPLMTQRIMGKGQILGVYFSLSGLLTDYALKDQFDLFSNSIRCLMQGTEIFRAVRICQGVYCFPWKTVGGYQIHLINGIGERPLRDQIPCHDIEFQCRWDGERTPIVYSALEDAPLQWNLENGYVTIKTECLKCWDMIVVECGEESAADELVDRETLQDDTE